MLEAREAALTGSLDLCRRPTSYTIFDFARYFTFGIKARPYQVAAVLLFVSLLDIVINWLLLLRTMCVVNLLHIHYHKLISQNSQLYSWANDRSIVHFWNSFSICHFLRNFKINLCNLPKPTKWQTIWNDTIQSASQPVCPNLSKWF